MEEDHEQAAEREASITVPPDSPGLRADRALANALPDWSRQRLQGLFDEGKVTVNDVVSPRRTKVAGGDVIKVQLPPPPSTVIEPMSLDLEVLFEDEHLIAVNKPGGVVTHPGAGVEPPTLCHGILHQTGGVLAQAAGEVRPGVVHRLDKPTTGVIVFAKTDEAYYSLVEAFSQRLTKKEYWAIVAGQPQLEAGSIQAPMGRDSNHRTRMAVRDDGRDAHTDWNVEERLGARHTLIHCRIHTGRTHQIRVHLSHLGFPLLGDSTYGYRPREGETHPGDFFLHAGRLSLPHPISGEELTLTAPRPSAFEEQLASLRA